MTTQTVLEGDWRSGAYGANRRAHLFIWHPFNSHKAPACGARGGTSYGRRETTVADACRDCLIYGAANR